MTQAAKDAVKHVKDTYHREVERLLRADYEEVVAELLSFLEATQEAINEENEAL